MTIAAEIPLLLALPPLALIDGLSAGTLLVPLLLLLAPGRVRVARILLYLTTITLFYVGIGVLLSFGLVQLFTTQGEWLSSTAGLITRLVLGIALVVVACIMPGGRRPAATHAGIPEGSRLVRWRETLMDSRAGGTVVVGVALAAGVVELSTMFPYIAAMSLLADAGLPLAAHIAAVIAYGVVMIAPALILLAVRVLARGRVDGPLQRLATWVYRLGSGETMAWIVGIIGFLVARSAADALGLFRPLSELIGAG